jgi:hypothetical protein
MTQTEAVLVSSWDSPCAGAQNLTTLSNVKAWLGLQQVATDDDLLSRMISAYSRAVYSYLARNILTAQYNETRNGTGTSTLYLVHIPVQRVVSLEIDGQAILPSPDTKTPGWVLARDAVYLRGRIFPRHKQNVNVVYVAGYDEVPFDIEQAVIEWVGFRYREKNRTGAQSKALAGETGSFMVTAIPPQVQHLIDQYKKVVSPW